MDNLLALSWCSRLRCSMHFWSQASQVSTSRSLLVSRTSPYLKSGRPTHSFLGLGVIDTVSFDQSRPIPRSRSSQIFQHLRRRQILRHRQRLLAPCSPVPPPRPAAAPARRSRTLLPARRSARPKLPLALSHLPLELVTRSGADWHFQSKERECGILRIRCGMRLMVGPDAAPMWFRMPLPMWLWT